MGFSVMGQIADWGAIVAFFLVGLMFLLVLFGIAHARRTDDVEELFPPRVREPKAMANA
jgi:hypothetical protein